jgi:tRNA threonylcarbamoyladenosine biosynthesis protein TsaE
MYSYRFTTKSPEETQALAGQIAAQLVPGDVLAMVGNLAAGKTTFTQGITSYCKVAEYALSPTFTYINEYHGEVMDVIHIDAYRLSTGEELISMGLWEYFESGAIIIIEWADIVASAIPEDALSLTFKHIDGDERLREIQLNSPRKLEIHP